MAGYAGNVPGIDGTGDQAITAFTLMKVVGRDVWIGIWAFVLAIISTTKLGGGTGSQGPRRRKFGGVSRNSCSASSSPRLSSPGDRAATSLADYNKTVMPARSQPIKDLRTWAFIFGFLTIGLDHALPANWPPPAPSRSGPSRSGVAVNVVLGFLLSAVVFASLLGQSGQVGRTTFPPVGCLAPQSRWW